MIRRSLRIGIRLGLLTGLAFVLFKIVQSRRTPRALTGAEGDGWAPSADGRSSSSPGPVLVRPTMPEREVGQRDRAVTPEASVEAPSVAPGPPEPFAMVEPDPAVVTDPLTAAEETPLDAVAAPAVDVEDPLARALQVEPVEPPPAAPPAKKRAAVRKAAKKAAGPAPARGAKKAAKKAAKKVSASNQAAAAPAAKKAVTTARTRATRARRQQTGAGWVEPVGGTCPSTHPVKAKMASRIFHLPGMAAYDRTSADRCYSDAAAAESDGLRPAKR